MDAPVGDIRTQADPPHRTHGESRQADGGPHDEALHIAKGGLQRVLRLEDAGLNPDGQDEGHKEQEEHQDEDPDPKLDQQLPIPHVRSAPTFTVQSSWFMGRNDVLLSTVYRVISTVNPEPSTMNCRQRWPAKNS